jgi:hypothetical protein
MRGKMKRHQEIDGDDYKERQDCQSDWRRYLALIAVDDLSRIECAGCRCALAHDLVLGRVHKVDVCSIALALPARPRFGE